MLVRTLDRTRQRETMAREFTAEPIAGYRAGARGWRSGRQSGGIPNLPRRSRPGRRARAGGRRRCSN